MEAQKGQNFASHRTCGTMANHQRLMQMYPESLHEQNIIEQKVQDFLAANPNIGQSRATYTIPIVFHIVWNNNSDNIADQYILAQLEQLNDDFSATNADIGSVPGIFQNLIGNVDIEFCLATVDPNGNPTTGINRVQTSQTSFQQFDAIKFASQGGVNAWDTNTYFNVWVGDIGAGLLGYAQFPTQFASSPNTDGLVLNTNTVGSLTTPNPVNWDFRFGRTATHELGHCLGLFHIWGDDNGSCTGSDQVADTPNQASENYGCPGSATSCGSSDMVMNYMDYVNDNCMFMFSQGQADRITGFINSYQYLQNKIAASTQVCGAVAPQAGISGGNAGCPGDAIQLNNATSGSADTYSWSFPGGVPSSSTAQNPPTVTYANAGTYTVTLNVSGPAGSSSANYSVEIVDCNNFVCNTLDHLNGGAPTLVADPNGGYISGNNSYGDIAKAEYFDDYGSDIYLQEVDFDFGLASGGGNVNFVIWDGSTGTPGDELVSVAVSRSAIAADVSAGNLTTVDFGLFQINNPIFVGFEVPSSGDIAVRTNSDGQTNPTTAWEQWGNGDWYPFNDYTNTNTTWEIDVAMAIYPRVCSVSSVPQAPVANFGYQVISQGCETIQIQFSDNSTFSPTSWNWSFPGGSPASSSMQNPVVSFSGAGNYGATLSVSNNLGSDSQTQNNIINVPAAIEANGSISGNTFDVQTNPTLTATDNTTGVTTRSWNFGDGSLSNGQNPSHTYTQPGTYTVTLTVGDGICDDVQTWTVEVTGFPVSIENVEGLSGINIRPNPVNDNLYVDLASTQNVDLTVDLYDAVGRKVVQGQAISFNGTSRQTFDVSGLAAGTYFLRITDGKSVSTHKVLKF